MSDPVPPNPAPPKPAPTPPPPPSTLKGIKETIESILIAFILAFVFRAFIVEAFVIPTGSMATTLLGAHMRFTCRECGYNFTVNYSNPNRNPNSSDIDIPARYGPELDRHTGRLVDRYLDAWCPNCRFKVPDRDAKNPLIHYGDRILVLKYIYLVSPAQRWDVVVFKDPTYQPDKAQWYSQNYIKRLIGLPGETLMILDGDIFVKDGDTWKIQTKPAYAQEAMWRVVYDHDHRPMNQGRKDGWQLHAYDNAAHAFHFDKLRGAGAIRFEDSAEPSYFTDWLAYNPNDPHRRRDFPLSDLRLAFTYERHDGTGPLRASISKRDTTFIVEIKNDQLQVFKRQATAAETKSQETPLLSRAYPLNPTKRARIEMMNVDHQFTLRVNDEVLCEHKYDPNVAQLLADYRSGALYRSAAKPNITIEAADQKATLSHISLWRDVYYTPGIGGQRADHASPEDPIVLKPDFGKREYFVLGDNSEQSSDARFWTRDIDLPDEDLVVESGRVPERFMLGRAFFVYWPAGYKPFTETAPSLVPNFGEMRLIH
jgi:signal peptidase I